MWELLLAGDPTPLDPVPAPTRRSPSWPGPEGKAASCPLMGSPGAQLSPPVLDRGPGISAVATQSLTLPLDRKTDAELPPQQTLLSFFLIPGLDHRASPCCPPPPRRPAHAGLQENREGVLATTPAWPCCCLLDMETHFLIFSPRPEEAHSSQPATGACSRKELGVVAKSHKDLSLNLSPPAFWLGGHGRVTQPL